MLFNCNWGLSDDTFPVLQEKPMNLLFIGFCIRRKFCYFLNI